jgi:hypothetical protein
MTVRGKPEWAEIILRRRDPGAAWADIFAALQAVALNTASPVTLHDATVAPDRLLAEAAWELWEAYPEQAEKTSENLKTWTNQEAGPSAGKAALIVDALSLREMPYILGAAEARGIAPALIKVTGAECPSSTDQFAASLGLPARAALAHDGKPRGFALFSGNCRTDVLHMPFEDCAVPPSPNIVFWHTWLDDLIHVQKKTPDVVSKSASAVFQGDGFWDFVNKLRQGRNLVITSDHGYAVSKLFSSEIADPDDIALLRDVFGASRHIAATAPMERKFMPPVVLERDRQHVIMGQRKWKVSGGFPHICHGGMSLLEVAVPWLEFAAL